MVFFAKYLIQFNCDFKSIGTIFMHNSQIINTFEWLLWLMNANVLSLKTYQETSYSIAFGNEV